MVRTEERGTKGEKGEAERKVAKAMEEKIMELKLAIEEMEAKDSEFGKHPCREIGCLSSGIIHWELEMAGESSHCSPSSSIGGLSFRLGWNAERIFGQDHLIINLCCDGGKKTGERRNFAAAAGCTLTLASPGNETASVFFFTLFESRKSCASGMLLPLSHAALPENDRFTLEARITMVAYYKNEFVAPRLRPLPSDVTLLVEGKKFRASKEYLAGFSQYFKVLFCSDFAEKKKDEIGLDKIDADDFEEMLGVISPLGKEITAAALPGLLRMADFFDVPFLFKKCTDFLLSSNDFSLAAKLLFSEEFRLHKLQYHLHFLDATEAINSADFGDLSERLQMLLLQKQLRDMLM